jgi:hypothetical protein
METCRASLPSQFWNCWRSVMVQGRLRNLIVIQSVEKSSFTWPRDSLSCQQKKFWGPILRQRSSLSAFVSYSGKKHLIYTLEPLTWPSAVRFLDRHFAIVYYSLLQWRYVREFFQKLRTRTRGKVTIQVITTSHNHCSLSILATFSNIQNTLSFF